MSIRAQGEGTVISEGSFDYRITGTGAEVIKFYPSGSGEVVVPSQVQGHPVTAIGAEVFQDLSGITGVVLQEGIRSIGDRAFYACTDLVSVQLPNTLQSIGEMAFCNCYALTALQIPASVQTIGLSAFLNCSAMQSLQVTAGNPYYTAQDNVLFSADMSVLVAYLNTKPNTSYTIPEQVRRIGEKAFQESVYLQEVVFPAGLYEIEKYAFSGSAALTAVHIPDSVGIIGAFAFSNCGNLTSAVLGWNVTAVPTYAFNNCGNLKNVVLPDQLQTIERKAFAGCGRLEDICIPDSLREIANDAFEDTVPARVRFFTTAQKNVYAGRFPQSQIICLCKTPHTYHPSDLLNCTVCDYVLDLNAPPVLASKTHDTVQLVVQPEREYSYDLVNWRKDGLFTGLTPEQTYSFYSRLSNGGELSNQVSQPLVVTMDKKPHLSESDHAYGQTVTAPTCTANGYTTYTCECGSSFVGNEQPALGHDMGGWTSGNGEEFRACSRCGLVETRPMQPQGNLLKLEGEDLLSQSTVWINGLPYPVQNGYVALPGEGDCYLVTYTYHVGDANDVHSQYPTGMKIYKVTGGTIQHIPELDNILQYSGSSIRITGKKGIRMITSLTKSNKAALTGGGLAGFTLVEYGTALCWASEIAAGDALVLGRPFTRSNYAYKKGVADPVFANSGNLTQYTNVLVGFSLDQCRDDIAMRPYIILQDGAGNQITLYGGTIYRSIGYIAYQNRNVFKSGTGSYKYVWEIIHHVYGKAYDADYKG